MDRNEPVIVMPVVYWLSFNMWRWCRLGDLCQCVARVAELNEINYKPSHEQLITDFASLVLPNRLPGDGQKKKIFRYSVDGSGFWGTEVPSHGNQGFGIDPPSAPFRLDHAVTSEMFVPEGWARDVLRAVWKGAQKSIDAGERGLFSSRKSRDSDHSIYVPLDRFNQEESR